MRIAWLRRVRGTQLTVFGTADSMPARATCTVLRPPTRPFTGPLVSRSALPRVTLLECVMPRSDSQTKWIVVTGGVMSGLGTGVVAASIGRLFSPK